jgi:hypothetical protein
MVKEREMEETNTIKELLAALPKNSQKKLKAIMEEADKVLAIKRRSPMTYREPVKPWSMASAIEQINYADFECEGGHLKNSDAWLWMQHAAERGPEFWPGQFVWLEVSATVAGQTLRDWRKFQIVGCSMSSDTERRFWVYSLSTDPPDAYHYGEVQFSNIRGDQLRLEKPNDR